MTVFADSRAVSITTLLPLRDVGEAGEGGSCEGNMEERRTIPGRHHRICASLCSQLAQQETTTRANWHVTWSIENTTVMATPASTSTPSEISDVERDYDVDDWASESSGESELSATK